MKGLKYGGNMYVILVYDINLDEYIRENKDSVILFKSRSQKWLEKEFLGKIEEDKTSNFL